MRVTPHSALAISTCALALLSYISSVYPYGGVFENNGDNTITTYAQKYVMEHQKELGLSNIRWCGGDGDQLSLARVTWNENNAFMKCDTVTKEVKAFKALKEAKRLTDLNTLGRQNVMDPLLQFDFYEENGVRYFCHLYSYIDGVLLSKYFKEHSISEAYSLTASILPEVIKGSIYLYNAGIIHKDIVPKNIMLQLGSDDKIVGVKIIDLDLTNVFAKEQGWQPIHQRNREEFLPIPIQRYESCNVLRNAILEFLGIFVNPNKTKNPFSPAYVLTEQTILSYFMRLKQSQTYIKPEQGNIKAAIPAVIHLTQAYYTMWHDNFPCSSPILVLMEKPPRIGIHSRPTSLLL